MTGNPSKALDPIRARGYLLGMETTNNGNEMKTLTVLGAQIVTFLAQNLDPSEPGYSDIDAARIGRTLGKSAKSIARSITHISRALVSVEGREYSDNAAELLDTLYYLTPAGWKGASDNGVISIETYNRAAEAGNWTPIASPSIELSDNCDAENAR